ncbi:MAG: DUF962 domain-containing protein [Idiomarina sp.]|nr:DUF962 domain-containing protein [Idiomarina sp.]
MKSIVEHLAQYSCYHRDRRNVLTHFVGIPLIVFGILVLLSKPAWEFSGFVVSPAIIVVLLAVVFYFLLDLMFGVLMAILLALAVLGGQWFAELSTTAWFVCGIAFFVIGWVFQFVGHFFEGRKPAFVDDLMGLAIGPLFVVAEAVFLLGLRRKLYERVEARVAEILPQMPPAEPKFAQN